MESTQILSPEILTLIVGFVCTTISAIVTWFLSRKKYKAEVNSNVIENMQKSLEFYKQLSDDTSRRLDEVLERNNKLEDKLDLYEGQIRDLQRQIFALMNSTCNNLTCTLRERDETILKLRGNMGIATTVRPKEHENTNR